MRGVIDKLLGLMPLIFLMMILLLANFYIVGQISPEDIKEVLDEEPETIDETDIEGYTKQFESLEEALHFCEGASCVTLDDEPHQASEIACQISNDIFNDFRIYGESDRYRSGYCYDEECIISAAMFTLRDYPYNSSWESIFYRENPANPLAGLYCHLCYENPDMMALDETCLNYNFMNKTIVSTTFCTSQIDTASGLEAFGNSRCSRVSINPSSWIENHCSGEVTDFCFNDIDRVIWYSDTNADPYTVYDKLDRSSFQRYAATVDPITYDVPHMYGVIWDADNKRYEVVFVRIPEKPTNPLDYAHNVDDIVSMLDIFVNPRYNPLGHWYSHARSVSNTIYENTIDVPMSELLSEVQDLTGTDLPSCDFSCSSEENCFITEPIIADKCVPNRISATYTLLTELPVRVKTNFNCNLNLTADTEYAVSVKNWYSYYYSGFARSHFCVGKYDRSITIYELG